MTSSRSESSTAPACAWCGGLLHEEDLWGLCPACLFRIALDEEPSTSPAGLLNIPGYEVQSEVARGGMGIVYRAVQLEPRREVALKMLLPHQSGAPGMLERFRLEARAIAALEHPAILPVYHVGEHNRLPFFTMKLALGGALAQRKGEFAGDWRRIAELMVTLADAVQFAHERAVLHRDLKPGNVLFDEAGRAYVSDFGLAKLVGAPGDLTRSVDLLGTPHYVAPEVAAHSAKEATIASDVYSLGAILYELLAGRPPFEAEGVPALLKKIAEEEPGRISDSAPVPRDLEVICFKCLGKQPGRRYASARDFGDDLRRWLEGRTILARPATPLERVQSWSRRNPALAVLAAALILVLAGAVALQARNNRHLQKALAQSQRSEARAMESVYGALLSEARARGAALETGRRWRALDVLGQAAKVRPTLELRNEIIAALARPDLREIVRFPAFIGDTGSPVMFTPDLDKYISPEPGGGFVIRRVGESNDSVRLPTPAGTEARWFVLSEDGSKVAVTLSNQELEIWALDGKAPLLRLQGTSQKVPVVAFHPDGEHLATFTPDEDVLLREFGRGASQRLASTNGRALFMKFDPAGRKLAVVRESGGVELWHCDGESAKPVLAWAHAIRRPVPWIGWSPDSRRLLAAGDDSGGLRLLSAASGQIELVYSGHLRYPRQFEFHPDGRVVASLGQDWKLRLWDSRTGEDLVSGVGHHRVMRFSRDGRRLSNAPGDRELAVLELAPNSIFEEYSGDRLHDTPNAIAKSDDDRWLASVGRSLFIWDLEERRQISGFEMPSGVWQYAFFDRLVPALYYTARDCAVFRRPFQVHSIQQRSVIEWGAPESLTDPRNGMVCQTFAGGRSWVFLGDSVELWPNGDPRHARGTLPAAPLWGVAASENGRWIAAVRPEAAALSVWDALRSVVITNLPARRPNRVWFSPDSRWLVASDEHGYRLWATDTWQPGPTLEAQFDAGTLGDVTFAVHGQLMAVRQERDTYRLIRFPNCEELATLTPPLSFSSTRAILNRDGSRLWIVGYGHRLFEWNIAALRDELAKLGLNWQ